VTRFEVVRLAGHVAFTEKGTCGLYRERDMWPLQREGHVAFTGRGTCGLYRERDMWPLQGEGHVAFTGKTELRVGLRVGKTEENRSLVIYRPKWEDNVRHVMRNGMEAPGLV
jgi:hypothetical protein